LANEYRKNGELDQAIALCEAHLGDQPGNMNGQVVYGQALFDAGRYDDADKAFNATLGLDPENLIALRHLGDISRLNGNVGAALDWYKRVLDADPRNDEILGFIEELKSAAAPPPPPPRDPTPMAAPAVPTPIATPAVPPKRTTVPTPAPAPITLEIDVDSVKDAVAARTAPTPVEPVAPPPRKSEPKKRVSLGLIDLDISMASDAAAAADAPPAAPPEAPAEVPTGEIDLGSVDFDSMPSAPEAPSGQPMSLDSIDVGGQAEGFEAGEFVPPVGEAIPAAEGLEANDGLGWDMGGTVDLDAPAEAPSSGESTEPRPQVFVTETMAELYLQQGFRDEALKVYRQLAEQNPDDASLRERIAALEGGGRASMSFEKLATEEPELAAGTASIVPMSEPAPSIDESLSFDEAPTPAAPIPEVPVESLDFDMSTSIPAADGSIVPPTPISTGVIELDMDAGDPEPAAAAMPTPSSAPTPVRAITPSGPSARAFFALLAQRRALRPDGTLPKGMDAVAAAAPAPVATNGDSLDSLFSAAPAAADDAMGMALMTAVAPIETAAPIKGRPTQQAGSELSLDSVFRGETGMRTSGPPQRRSQLLKFDQFFAADQPAEEAPPSPDAPAAPADDAQFQAWLSQLKGQ
jgi:tetratricopeptide (TPR) repeat protein